jgi:hypothetical protein
LAAEPRNGHELARVLMRKAAGDEIVLERLIEDGDVPDDVLGFHAQQARREDDQGSACAQ